MTNQDGARCSKRILRPGMGFGHSAQCSRSAVKGTAYCGIHDPAYIAVKDKEKRARWDAASKLRQKAWNRLPNAVKLLKLARRELSTNGAQAKLAKAIDKFLEETLR